MRTSGRVPLITRILSTRQGRKEARPSPRSDVERDQEECQLPAPWYGAGQGSILTAQSLGKVQQLRAPDPVGFTDGLVSTEVTLGWK